jgi:uncharacterized membrane protein
MKDKILVPITSNKLKQKSIVLTVEIYHRDLIRVNNTQKQGVNASIGFVVNVFLLLIICLLSYIKHQTKNISIDYLCMATTIAISYLLWFTVLMTVWHGYIYIKGIRSNENGLDNMLKAINIALVLPFVPLLVVYMIISFVQLSSNISSLDLAKHLLLTQIDEEQKCLLCDARAEWKRLGLNLWQIKRKELIFILFLCWGQFIAWCNYEKKKPRV